MVQNYYYILISQQTEPEALGVALGRNVRKFRTEQQINICELSFITKISRRLLADIEKGCADVRLSYVERIAKALCVHPLQLFEP